MSILLSGLYVLSVYKLISSFLNIKKSDQEKSILESIVLSIVLFMGLNILIGTFFGLLKIKCNFLVYIIVNYLLSFVLYLKVKKADDQQKHTFKGVDASFLIFANIFPIESLLFFSFANSNFSNS